MRFLSRGVAAVLLAAPWGAAAFAQAPLATPTLTYAIRSRGVRFQIVAGRVSFGATPFGNMSSSSNSIGRSERLNIAQVDSGGPSLRYELSTAEEKLSIDASGSRLHIVRAPKADARLLPVEFQQAPHQPLCLTVGPQGRQREFRAASLWHLLIIQPEVCRQHLVPLLELFQSDWELARVAGDVEKELLRLASGGALLDHARWAALVEQLGDNQFARREEADRQLRAASFAVLGYLQQLDLSRLDAEQQFRVRRIISGLTGQLSGETAGQIALWLSGEADVWLSLLSRPDPSTRRLAAQQLAAVWGEPIAFDPDASEEVRLGQIEKLRARIAAQKNGAKSPPD